MRTTSTLPNAEAICLMCGQQGEQGMKETKATLPWVGVLLFPLFYAPIHDLLAHVDQVG